MHFMLSEDAATGGVQLAEQLRTALYSDKQVLWLISGGSNLPTTVNVMQQLNGTPTKKLTIAFNDERYGPVGHPDSNLKQLYDGGFDPFDASVIEVLHNKPLAETVADYGKTIGAIIDQADTVIGQFGIGPDGHICGILPGSPAVDSQEPVVGYQGGGFTRITLTPTTLVPSVKLGYIFAWGENKKSTLLNLRDKELSLNEQPAQLLKKLPEAYIFNDQIGDAS